MIKFFGGLLVGVFVGALAIEVIERSSPELAERVREKGRNLRDRIRGTPEYVDNVLRRNRTAPDSPPY